MVGSAPFKPENTMINCPKHSMFDYGTKILSGSELLLTIVRVF